MSNTRRSGDSSCTCCSRVRQMYREVVSDTSADDVALPVCCYGTATAAAAAYCRHMPLISEPNECQQLFTFITDSLAAKLLLPPLLAPLLLPLSTTAAAADLYVKVACPVVKVPCVVYPHGHIHAG
jgi:hypothetical protein